MAVLRAELIVRNGWLLAGATNCIYLPTKYLQAMSHCTGIVCLPAAMFRRNQKINPIAALSFNCIIHSPLNKLS